MFLIMSEYSEYILSSFTIFLELMYWTNHRMPIVARIKYRNVPSCSQKKTLAKVNSC